MAVLQIYKKCKLRENYWEAKKKQRKRWTRIKCGIIARGGNEIKTNQGMSKGRKNSSERIDEMSRGRTNNRRRKLGD